ncbi:hypothetical protein E2C01_071603 [Portunus trituberculatus]|uniref:Uncharacterized protein n=1 Tax=Portunus trituberculatus TaxID=210409 RepID=A0A5B7I5C8_PORTR|nr:hypothetical protein [Portunus trituberculatus]
MCSWLLARRHWEGYKFASNLAASMDEDEGPICLGSFKDYPGRRLHQMAAHPDAFHGEEVQALSAGSRRARWDLEELAMTAAFEALHLGAHNINKD